METSLLATKLFIPTARPGMVERPRLMERLRDVLGCPFTLVSAPAGFGKSALVSEWARQNKGNAGIAWVSLDAGDNDPVRFWDYLIAALQTLKNTSGESALGLLHSPQPYATEAVLTALINDIADMTGDFAVILDDYHVIKTEAIHEGVTFLLEHLPPRMHLIIATRVDPPLPLARFRGKWVMLDVGADDLRFTLKEATSLLKEMLGPALSSEDITALNDRTEGWAVGLKMAALSMRGREDIGGFIATFTGSQRYVMDYLVEEVLAQQSDEAQDFFLKTSVLERLTASLCDTLIGHNHSQATLEKLERANLFLIPLDESRQWYRYHHLFAELLRHQLALKSGAKEVTALHKKASQWYEDNSFPDDAIHHTLVAEDWERATRLLTGVAGSRLKRGENVTVLTWIRTVPDEVLRTDLHLYLQYARALLQTGQLDAAEVALDFLETAAHEDTNVQGEVVALQADLAMRRGDIPQAIALAERALSLLPPGNHAYRCRASHILGVVAHDRGSYDEAWSRMTDAYETGRLAEDYLFALEAFSYLGNILHLQGKLHRAAELSRQAVDLAGQSLAAGPGRYFLGDVLYEWNKLEESTHNFQLAVELLRMRGTPDNMANSNMGLARVRLAQSDLPATTAALDKSNEAASRGSIRPATRARLAAWRCLLAIRQNDLTTALRWSNDLAENLEALPFQFRHFPTRLLIAKGDKAAATEQLKECYQNAVQAGAYALVIEIRVYQALAAATPEKALAFLSEALTLGQPEGFIRTFVDEGKLLAPLLRKALAQGVTPEYTAKLINIIEAEERQRQVRSGEVIPTSQPTGILSGRELEILRLVVDGLSNRQISEKLIISLGTVKTHVHNIFEKLDAKTRTQAIGRARELKLL